MAALNASLPEAVLNASLTRTVVPLRRWRGRERRPGRSTDIPST
ncbi:hypothetical protein ACIPRD_08025 [Streptomyces sp. NPDC090108]